jgi:hypothetical protein
VADHEQENSQEPLTEREQEAIQELAKAIVREAGLAREPEQETAGNFRRELIESGQGYWQAQVDFFKHMTTVSAATVVGVPAVIKAFSVLQ